MFDFEFDAIDTDNADDINDESFEDIFATDDAAEAWEWANDDVAELRLS